MQWCRPKPVASIWGPVVKEYFDHFGITRRNSSVQDEMATSVGIREVVHICNRVFFVMLVSELCNKQVNNISMALISRNPK